MEETLRQLRPAKWRRSGRICIAGREYMDLSSNDYLGLAAHPRMIEAAKAALDRFGTGSSASRLLSGDLELHHELEEATASFKGKDAALVFNSGYQANCGIFSALLTKDDAVFSDRLIHASVIDGIELSGARLFRFLHNDTGHLADLLKSHRKKFRNAIIVTETIFSMDGDRPDLKEMVRLKDEYGANLMVDEAHATGIYGPNGSGVVEEDGLSGEVDIIMGTFSKALGSFGAYIAASRPMIDNLVNRCRSFIYSTSLPPAVIAADMMSLELVAEEPHRRQRLLRLADDFRAGLKAKGFDVRGRSQIVPLMIGDNLKSLKLAEALREKGYWALPIRPPTVPPKEARLRFSLSFDHDPETLRRLPDEIIYASI